MLVNVISLFFLFLMNTGTVVIEVNGLKNTDGQLFISLYNNADDFPEVDKEYLIIVVDSIPGTTVTVRFEDIPYGDYAMAMFHDENRSGEIDKNFFGIPKEGYCFSKNFKPVLSAPDFGDCSFTLDSGSVIMVSKVIN